MTVAYDHSVRENAMSNPAAIIGANIKKRSPAKSSRFLLCGAALLVGLDVTENEAVITNSAMTRVSVAQASAANSADEKLIRTATFPNGSNEAR